MPDDRLFHKRLGHSERVNSLTDFEDLVWRAYILSADDFGVMRFSAVSLQSDSDRMASKPQKTVQKALERVRDAGLIHTFDHQGRTYCYQRDWQEWQKVDYPRTTVHPAPPLDGLSTKTRELFAKHPGGWGRKGGGTSANGSTNVPQTSAEGSPTPSATFTPEPLAVSRKPLATSRKPVPDNVVSVADARSKRPIFKGQRLTVFEWMLDDLCRLLGPSTAEAFDLHEWFFTLDARALASNEAVPQRDGGKWLQEKTLAEAQARGLVGGGESALTSALRKASNGFIGGAE